MTSHTPLTRVLGWLAAAVFGGWLIAYNLMRLGGDDPRTAALPALVIGIVAGGAVFAVAYLVVTRLHTAGRVVRAPVPEAQIDGAGGSTVLTLALVLGVAALAALVVALLMAADYSGIDGARPRSTLLLIAWDVVFGLWLGDEALRLERVRRGVPTEEPGGLDAGGLDSIWFGCLLTCVLAGVAYSRDVVSPAQVVLVVVAGAAAAIVSVGLWRLRGGHGLPLGAPVAVAVAVLSILLPAAV